MTFLNDGKTALAMLFVCTLAACGGGGGDEDQTPTPASGPTPNQPPAPSASKFTQSATWTLVMPAAGRSVCFDFDARAEVGDCSGNAWDLKVVSGGRSAQLYTNSGPSGRGNGAASSGPFTQTWVNLSTWKDARVDPVGGTVPAAAWLPDTAKSAFSGSNTIQSGAFEYDLNGTHQLSPNFRTYLVTTNSASPDVSGAAGAVYALQVTGYYGGPTGTAAGWPSFRWIDRANRSALRTATVNASAGWVYFDLERGTQTTESATWHIAFNRYNIKLNGGISGSGTVAGHLARTPTGFYGADGKPVPAQFNATTNLAGTLPDLTGELSGPANAAGWTKDSAGSMLNPDYTGTYPGALNFGWYTYYPTDAVAAPAGLTQHQLKANPDAAALLRSGEGNSYARMHVTNIQFAPATPAYTGQQTWTIQFDVQPAGQ